MFLSSLANGAEANIKRASQSIEDVGKFFAFQKDIEWDGYRADGSNGENRRQ